jgi:hypothetical protein
LPESLGKPLPGYLGIPGIYDSLQVVRIQFRLGILAFHICVPWPIRHGCLACAEVAEEENLPVSGPDAFERNMDAVQRRLDIVVPGIMQKSPK